MHQMQFYNANPIGQIVQRRDRNMDSNFDQYETLPEGLYSDADMEAHVLNNQYNTVEYRDDSHPAFAGFSNISPNTYNKMRSFVNAGNQSSFVSNPQTQIAGVHDYNEMIEQHHPRKYQRYRPNERDNMKQFDESELDEREAQMYSSMSQADLKNHIMENTNFEDHDQKDETQYFIDQIYQKLGKISRQYYDLVNKVKKTDYIRGYDTSVSYSKMKELENIETRFGRTSNASARTNSSLLKLVKTATKEIDDMHKQEYSEYPIENFVKFVKKQFTEVFLKNKTQLEEMNHTPISENPFQGIKDEDELESIKGKLNFQEAMDDLDKNYQYLKEKSFKAIEDLSQKHSQIMNNLEELKTTVSSINVFDGPQINSNRVISRDLSKLKDTENKFMNNVIEDVKGNVEYTYDIVCFMTENSSYDFDLLKEVVQEMHELLEAKINKIPGIISSGNLKADKKKERGSLYDLYAADPERSEKSETSRLDTNTEAEIRRDFHRLSSRVEEWKKYHKELFDSIHNNQKLQSRISRSNNSGTDSINILKDKLKESNRNLKNLINDQYHLHYNKSRKVKSNREVVQNVRAPSNSSGIVSQEPTTQSINIQPDQELIARIDSLTKEVEELRSAKSDAEKLNFQNSNLSQEKKNLQDQYDKIKENLNRAKNDLLIKNDEIDELNRNNDRLSSKVIQLKSDYNNLDQANRNDKESIHDLYRQAKINCENQIFKIEQDYETQCNRLRSRIDSKEKKLLELEDKLSVFQNKVLTSLQRESQTTLSQKLSEIHQLNSRNMDLKTTIEKLTNDKEIAENKLKRSQSIVKSLKDNIKVVEDEREDIRKAAEEQTTIANSLYEGRLNEKDGEIEALTNKLNKKESEISDQKDHVVELDAKLCDFESKIKEIYSLVKTYRKQIEQDTGRTNPTVKLIADELSTLIPKDDEEIELSDKASQIRELSRENNKLENQIEQLQWDIENEAKQTQRVQQQLERLQKELEATVLNKDAEMQAKDEQIRQANVQVKGKDELL